jgi:hypothetical protein
MKMCYKEALPVKYQNRLRHRRFRLERYHFLVDEDEKRWRRRGLPKDYPFVVHSHPRLRQDPVLADFSDFLA